MSTNDDIRDAFIRHQIFVQRYAKGREQEAEEFIRKVLEEAVSRLNVDLTTLSRARLDRLTLGPRRPRSRGSRRGRR